MSRRKTLLHLGERGQSVRVLVTALHTRVQWYERGQRRTRDFALTTEGRREADAFARGVLIALTGAATPRQALTTRELWLRYIEAEAPALRPKTILLHTGHWREWEEFVKPTTPADDAGPQTMAAFRAALERLHRAVSSIGRALRTVKRVYAWGEEHELVHDRVHRYRYKIAKDRRPAPLPEYTATESAAIVGQLRLDWRRTWRPGVILRLCAWQGVRQWSVLHLRPEDVDVPGRRITWQREWDKTGKTWTQPMREQTALAVAVALGWREALGYTGPWLVWQPRRPEAPYTEQALWSALCGAERRAGIPHLTGRGAHGLRRGLAGQIYTATGDVWQAMVAIGDTDIGVMRRYLVDDESTMNRAFAALDKSETVTETVIPPAGVPGSLEGHDASD